MKEPPKGKVIRFPVERISPRGSEQSSIKGRKISPSISVFFETLEGQRNFEESIIYLIRNYGEMTLRQILEHFPNKTAKVASSVQNLLRDEKIFETGHNIYQVLEETPEPDCA